MKKRILPLLLTLALLGSAVTLPALGAQLPENSNNYAGQNYPRWAANINSYLYDNGSGLTRVEQNMGHIVIENYTADFALLDSRTLELELPLWGGFFAGASYNFVVLGQPNTRTDNSVEVIRVIKYDKNWNRLGAASLKGANTMLPFDGGTLRCTESGGYLYIHTCRKMYSQHQANLTFSIRESDMSIVDSRYEVLNLDYGYVSHSFNQFLLIDSAGRLVTLDHGDGYPRGAVLAQYPAKRGGKFTGYGVGSVTFQTYTGEVGDNTTGATVGGLAETSKGYLAAHTYDGYGSDGTTNPWDPVPWTKVPYLTFIDKNTLKATVRALPYDSDKSASPPMLVPTGRDSGYVLWTEANPTANYHVATYLRDDGTVTYSHRPVTTRGDDLLSYVVYNADGTFGAVQTAENTPLSDCQPIVYNGKVTWYVTDGETITFYTLDGSGVSAHSLPLVQRVDTGGSGSPSAPTVSDQTTAFTLRSLDVTFTEVGESIRLGADFTPAGTSVPLTFRSLDPDVVTVTDDGLVEAVRPGATQVEVYAEGVGYAYCTFRCEFPDPREIPATFYVSPDQLLLTEKGQNLQVGIEFFPGHTSAPLTWWVEDPDVATVDENGLLTAVGEGTTYLNITAEGVTTAHYTVNCIFSDSGGEGTVVVFSREDIPATGTAYVSTQDVELDGAMITLPVYALKNEVGNETNYIRLRDLAALLKGTGGQFDVVYDGVINLYSNQPYDHPNGTEGNIPFSGDQSYAVYLEDTKVNGWELPLTAFQIFYNGGGHTYYKLRDLGKALGFNVGWDQARAIIFIETDKPYTNAD